MHPMNRVLHEHDGPSWWTGRWRCVGPRVLDGVISTTVPAPASGCRQHVDGAVIGDGEAAERHELVAGRHHPASPPPAGTAITPRSAACPCTRQAAPHGPSSDVEGPVGTELHVDDVGEPVRIDGRLDPGTRRKEGRRRWVTAVPSALLRSRCCQVRPSPTSAQGPWTICGSASGSASPSGREGPSSPPERPPRSRSSRSAPTRSRSSPRRRQRGPGIRRGQAVDIGVGLDVSRLLGSGFVGPRLRELGDVLDAAVAPSRSTSRRLRRLPRPRIPEL